MLLLLSPSFARAQEGAWAAEVSIGYAGFVDDATKNNFLVAGGVRRHVASRVSIGPEMVLMSNPGESRDRNVLLTGNVVVDAYPTSQADMHSVTPFFVGGLGMFWGRDQVRGGPFWGRDPAFTVGGGVRARVGESMSVAAEYRLGWELHHRLSATAGFHW